MAEQPTKALLLVGSPRTGSSLLARHMDQTNLLGRPEGEYFWRLQEQRWAEQFQLPSPDSDYQAYVAGVMPRATTANGVFASKIFWLHLQDLLRHTETFTAIGHLSAKERFAALFGTDIRAVLLERNCLDSALSLWRAEATNVWFELPGEDKPVPPSLDVWRLTVLHAEYHAAEVGWPHFLTAAGIPHMRLAYRDIARDVTACVALVAEFAGVSLPELAATPPALRRQADSATEAFRNQWTSATGGCAACQNQEESRS